MRKLITTTLLGLTFNALAVVAPEAPPPTPTGLPLPTPTQKFESGMVLVNITPDANQTDVAKIKSMSGVKIISDSTLLVPTVKGKELEMITSLSSTGIIPELDSIYSISSVSNDTYNVAGSAWDMGGGYGMNAETAWANGHTDCSSVIVAIMDEGTLIDHEDLVDNVWTNPGDSTFDGVDNDGNGFIDDVHGWDFDGNNKTVFDGGYIRKDGWSSYTDNINGKLAQDAHGTHVAGTIGATGGNAKGIAGVCWKVKILPVKTCGFRRGCVGSTVIRAINYLIALKQAGNNIVAVNCSFGGGAAYPHNLQSAISAAGNAGILFVFAAGNSTTNLDTTPLFPASLHLPNMITVASLNSSGSLSSFSNYGANSVDIAAPGETIWSTIASSYQREYPLNRYFAWSGTSMATPHVAGAAALYKAYHPSATLSDIKTAILNSAIATPSLSGKTVTGGRLNVSGF